jgi:hypothetical protein
MNSSKKRPEQKSSNVGAELNAVSLNFVERRLIPRAFPSPEVIEGSESSDWALWEEVVASQARHKPANAPEKEILDPFASVRKHGG